MTKKRYLEKFVIKDLKDKMVFIAGPRQVGKTTLAVCVGDKFYPDRYSYLNWDNREDRRIIIDSTFRADKGLIIFDEIHKYKNWKNYLKGEYDKYKDKFKMLITGSARLNIYRKGGDSLLGRYYYYRLHPFSLNETLGKTEEIEVLKELVFSDSKKEARESFGILLKFGGFPEPFIKQSEKILRRWHNQRMDRIIKEDIRDIENIRDLSALQLLVEILPGKVGSLLSLNSLREDLGVTHKTISLWVDILERFYYHFRVYPFRNKRIKSLKKEPKIYLWDWSELPGEGERFENIVASHLLKFCHFLVDSQGYKANLYYLRDIEKREVDFLVTIDEKPWFCVEVKTSFKEIPSHLRYFKEKLKIPFVYEVVKEEGIDFLKDNIRVISASKFLTALV
ncbi:MAG: ATP-binding protein [Candidatus Omnitrophica bacterium]|nr:ATP-binding protein [Candidatus Omnitrophota bacterium]MBU1134299.1 ATP-binding protein [Candidatus Omnitrophota bacterium]MBU1366619.1 ATP-binding protein [Candidatus Omnitrophota bacterium]MBU1524651.1 ATP-binding protein [Candidatus Omnitrophota bacterium]MBU1810966.1 ATP-binding protein [Candidatus Omnitrophota bacterium]